MISATEAAAHLKRLWGLRGAPDPSRPDGKAAMEEVVRAMRACPGNEVAKRVTEAVLEDCDFFPTPSQLHRLRLAFTEPRKKWCGRCVDGWICFDRNGYGCATPCQCRRSGCRRSG